MPSGIELHEGAELVVTTSADCPKQIVLSINVNSAEELQ